MPSIIGWIIRHYWLTALLAGCGFGREDRQEEINKLRTLGVSASPLVSIASTHGKTPVTVDLTLFAVIPTGTPVSVAAFKDSTRPSSGAVVLDTSAITVDTSTYKNEAHQGVQLFTAKAKVTIPESGLFKSGTGLVQYGFVVTAGDRTEKVIGNLLVTTADAPELKWQSPAIDITIPAANSGLMARSKTDIKATLANANDESVKYAWFCTTGSIDNRRAASTAWTADATGGQSLFVVAHGVKSRSFSIKVIDVTVQ